MKHRVAELEGALLDAAVAKANGLPCRIGDTLTRHDGVTVGRDGGPHCIIEGLEAFYPASTEWAIGGPILERELMIPMYGTDFVGVEIQGGHLPPQWGPTLLVAAMRAYVASKFGEEVELPG